MALELRDLHKEEAARRARYEMSAGAVGALAGAGFGGLFAGPFGAAAGAVVGAAMGAATGWAVEQHPKDEALHDQKLDREMGVIDGDIGAPGLKHPYTGPVALSREAAGVGGGGEPQQAAGPMQAPPDES
jgi:hypothetical protein